MDEAVVELSAIGSDIPPDVARQRDYWLGITLFKMRRRYADSARLLLGVYKQMGASAAEAMFHGARALSRADRDDDAIAWYHKVVAEYPSTTWAAEAQYLSGWLEFNREKFRAAIPPLEDSLARYPRSKFADNALWFLGMSHYLLGEWTARTASKRSRSDRAPSTAEGQLLAGTHRREARRAQAAGDRRLHRKNQAAPSPVVRAAVCSRLAAPGSIVRRRRGCARASSPSTSTNRSRRIR